MRDPGNRISPMDAAIRDGRPFPDRTQGHDFEAVGIRCLSLEFPASAVATSPTGEKCGLESWKASRYRTAARNAFGKSE